MTDIKKRRIAADGCHRIAVYSDSAHSSSADLIYAISYSLKNPEAVKRFRDFFIQYRL